MAEQDRTRGDQPLHVPEDKSVEQHSLEMTPEDLDRQNDPREAQQTNRVILSGGGTVRSERPAGGAGPASPNPK